MNLFSDHVFDKNAPNSYVPICNIIPSTMSMDDQEYLGSELQRLMELLGVKTGLFNIETCVDVNGIPYIMEVTPRGGGCGIAELQDMAMNAFFVENEIRKAVNMDIVQSECEKIDGYYCELVIHLNNEKPCIYKDISVREDISARNLKKIVMCVQPGDEVLPFTGANRSLGNAYLHCDNREELIELVDHSSEWLDIIVE